MNVEVLSPGQWQPLVVETGYPHATRLTRLLAAVHGRHAGLSTSLAADWLRGDAGGIRSRVRLRLADALVRVPKDAPSPSASSARANFLEVLPNSLLVMHCVVPLALQACKQIARSVLFGQLASAGADRAALGYRTYAQEFDESFTDLASTEGDETQQFFWDKVAFELIAAAHTDTALPSRGPRDSEPLNGMAPPDIDTGVLYFVKTLEPKFGQRTRSALPRLRQQQANFRKVPLKQGGVRGIRMTRSMADISDRLMSELIQPPIIRLDRLANSGFLIRHRPPPLDNRRDMLLVGLALQGAAESGMAFAKAVWLDAAERIAILMARAGIQKTDIAHITRWDDEAVTRVAVAVDKPSPYRKDLDAFAFGPRERLAMLRAHGWLPAFLDNKPRLLRSVDRTESVRPFNSAILRDLERCTLSAFQHFPETAAGTAGDRAAIFDSYGRIHVQLFLPIGSVERLEERGGAFGQLAQAIGLRGSSIRNTTVVGVPQRADQTFRILQARHPPTSIPGTDKDTGRDLDAMAAELAGMLLRGALETLDA
jgi:hypothetical protein